MATVKKCRKIHFVPWMMELPWGKSPHACSHCKTDTHTSLLLLHYWVNKTKTCILLYTTKYAIDCKTDIWVCKRVGLCLYQCKDPYSQGQHKSNCMVCKQYIVKRFFERKIRQRGLQVFLSDHEKSMIAILMMRIMIYLKIVKELVERD